jgi:hypothetical protein
VQLAVDRTARQNCGEFLDSGVGDIGSPHANIFESSQPFEDNQGTVGNSCICQIQNPKLSQPPDVIESSVIDLRSWNL